LPTAPAREVTRSRHNKVDDAPFLPGLEYVTLLA
jgi:hypothetical protein